MKRSIILLFIATALAAALPAAAAETSPDPSFVINTPEDGWESTSAPHQAPDDVKRILDCANEDPGEVKFMGWRLAADGRFQGAYCLSYQRRGMGRLRDILRDSNPEKAKQAGDKFIDTFASKLNDEYSRKRNMILSDLSADLMKADNDVIMIMDGMATGGGIEYMRGIVVFLHNDSLLNISSIYDKRAPETVKRALDAIPVSLRWR